jgi:hypothetical protein
VTHAVSTPGERAVEQRPDLLDRSASAERTDPNPRFSVLSGAAMLGLQRSAGNRAASALVARRPAPPVGTSMAQHPAEIQRMTDDQAVQRLGLDFLGDLAGLGASVLGGGDDAEPLQQGGAATCSEQPSFASDSPVPITINADTAVEFVQKMAAALGNPHMAPSFSYDPETDDRGRITKVNLKITTKIIRPRYGMGRGSAEEIALIRKAEGLIKAHEERHAAIAMDFAQKAVCAAIGKTAATYEAAIKGALCSMNKAQEALDKKEGMLTFTLSTDKTKVVDVGLGPFAGASYPC